MTGEPRTIFISQPMKGKTDKEIKKVRKQAIASATHLLNEPVSVIESFFEEAPVDANPLWHLGKAIKLLSGADFAYFAKGWENAR